MKVPLLMPQLGESIAEATVVSLAIEAGTAIVADQEIFEVETNKATMAVTAPCAGTVTEVTAKVDVSYPVGAVLGYLDATKAEARRAGVEPDPDPDGAKAAPASGSRRRNPSPADAGSHFREPGDTPDLHDPAVPAVHPTVNGLPVPVNATGASYISPRLRARMHELGINAADLSSVAGTGSGGRVTVEDFERFMSDLESHRMTQASPMRIAVADSMRRSWARPLATVGTPVQLDAVLAHRRAQNTKPGLALYAIRALGLALADDTSAAGRLVGERVVHPPAIDIGFAVEVPDGVLVPTLRDVASTRVADLVGRYNDLVDLARNRRLPRDATQPGIATVTNFGTFGIVWATPIPLPEQNLVLGLGMGRKRPLWDEEKQQFLPVTEAELTLSFDHRLLDGGGAGRLLNRVAGLLQDPESL